IRGEQQPLLKSLWGGSLARLAAAFRGSGLACHGRTRGAGFTGLQTPKELTKVFHDWLGIA
ncbi:MAG: hypothetical protein ISQ07_13450, partial [Pirellulales bacterium]|nr:hypothetical protein [Pirellulales bacterium]